ncbi:hypothetical protein C1S99_20145 [Vibrio parahaemolyticus]|uniref:hypothetical protein n=1 Tax=Vibrio parahaemolyticus TaxID=670 RepID=UPI000C86A82F|nr:hypothetical protein [Vibrio parahaemolyticus]PMS39991.1 hypothetical protein C1T12_21465 [Vibrio parahaemolyticus]PMS60126.1 hypothetical protein C1S91_22310 [Vibrio parahaemolyticus]PMS66247.1 hypothetical protein C1S96_20780 [Vibrio parahaemolyticus]PMS70978.1 hypothetical protein C1T10_23275 [Vibrio parahaemolyticus]PMS76383.1 hypothetical protein C1S88_21995 [Vibrio parahaemolyticus]
MSVLSTHKPAKDRRPKVISFNTALDGLNIAARQSVLWPCHAFNISIPQKKKNGLNVFEETVLKITEIESADTEKIALFTCLEKELVAFIQNRLNQLGLLNDRNELSEHGQELLNEWQNKSDGNLEYTVATVFVDLLSGKLLPYVSTEPMSYKKISRIGDKGFIDFLINPTNEKSRVSARQIRPAKDSFWKAVPDSNDIIRAIREFKKKYKRHALLNQGVDQYPPPVPMAEAISLHEYPELVYLHCNVLIQIGNSDLLVTDGCGFGFSESFANYLTSQDWKWVIDLKNKGIIDRLSSDQSNEESENESSAADGMKKYPRIARPLRRAQEYLSDAEKIEVDSSNDEQEFVRLTGLAVVALYEAIEWALRFVVSDNPVTHWERLFSSQSYRENDKILRSFATKIGFDVSDRVKALLQVKPGKIRAVDCGVSEMQPLLALAIAGAINDPNHPLNHLAIEDSGCLSFINALKEVRDPVSHGSLIDVELSPETLEGYRDRTTRLIQSLIPDITEDAYTAKTQQERDIDQVRLKARIELDKTLGLRFVQAVSPSLREELVKVTMLSQRTTLDNEQLQRYINLLASIMQLSLFEVAKDRRSSVKNRTNLKDEAIEKIVQSGFYPAPDAIPEQISTVNADRLYRAAQGSSTTLGAQLLALCLVASEGELVVLKRSFPKCFELIAKLIKLRGHGNQYETDFSRENLESLKINVFKLIKIIMEEF